MGYRRLPLGYRRVTGNGRLSDVEGGIGQLFWFRFGSCFVVWFGVLVFLFLVRKGDGGREKTSCFELL